MPTKPSTVTRIDQDWINAKSKNHDVLIVNSLFSRDFKLPTSCELLLPTSPNQMQFLDGVSTLYFIAAAYQSFLQTSIYEPRFISLDDIKQNNLVLTKGAKALPLLRVVKQCRDETVDTETGEVSEQFLPLAKPYRTYYNYFHFGDLALRAAPPCDSVIEGLTFPFSGDDNFDLLVADIVQSVGVDVVFGKDVPKPTYDEQSHRIMIAKPHSYTSLSVFHKNLIPQLIHALKNRLGWAPELTEVIKQVGSYFLFNYCLMRSPLGYEADQFIQDIERLDESELFYAVMFAEQASRHLLAMSPLALRATQYRVNVAARIKNHVDMFLHQDYSAMSDTSNHKATLQFSEENTVTF